MAENPLLVEGADSLPTTKQELQQWYESRVPKCPSEDASCADWQQWCKDALEPTIKMREGFIARTPAQRNMWSDVVSALGGTIRAALIDWLYKAKDMTYTEAEFSATAMFHDSDTHQVKSSASLMGFVSGSQGYSSFEERGRLVEAATTKIHKRCGHGIMGTATLMTESGDSVLSIVELGKLLRGEPCLISKEMEVYAKRKHIVLDTSCELARGLFGWFTLAVLNSVGTCSVFFACQRLTHNIVLHRSELGPLGAPRPASGDWFVLNAEKVGGGDSPYQVNTSFLDEANTLARRLSVYPVDPSQLQTFYDHFKGDTRYQEVKDQIVRHYHCEPGMDEAGLALRINYMSGAKGADGDVHDETNVPLSECVPQKPRSEPVKALLENSLYEHEGGKCWVTKAHVDDVYDIVSEGPKLIMCCGVIGMAEPAYWHAVFDKEYKTDKKQ